MKDRFLKNKTALKLYDSVKNLPIIDYHCHLVPEEIYADREFETIYEMWLKYDHYKWRLMRASGISEDYITGDKPEKEKFIEYIGALEFSANHPLYHWSKMELEMVFGIDDALTKANAEKIYEKANAYIKENHLSPRKIMKQFNVETVCTTDDVVDSLEFHEKIKNDETMPVKVLPSFRTDTALQIHAKNYAAYLAKLEVAVGFKIDSLETFKDALKVRLEYFKEKGCLISDVGIPEFPNTISSDKKADKYFKAALKGEECDKKDYKGFLGNMYLYLAKLYKENDITMQLHLGVLRDTNQKMLRAIGNNAGCDTASDGTKAKDLAFMLDAMQEKDALPKTIVYTLNEPDTEKLATVCYAFPGVVMGAAWWFNDHMSGIKNAITKISELGTLSTFPGMLTDSRSFLSYTRHDYFRRIICNLVGEWVEEDSYDKDSAETLVQKIAYENTKKTVSR